MPQILIERQATSRARTIAAHAVFAIHAQELREKRLAVLPIGPDRTPHVSGFKRLKHRPGAALVDKWREKFPTDNIAALPGLSGKGATVADCDALAHDDEFEDRFGKSELRVRTRRGMHFWYARVPFPLPGNLRKFGLDIDLKTGNQLVIVPPSVHPSGHVYRLEGCDWDALLLLQKLRLWHGERVEPFKLMAYPLAAKLGWSRGKGPRHFAQRAPGRKSVELQGDCRFAAIQTDAMIAAACKAVDEEYEGEIGALSHQDHERQSVQIENDLLALEREESALVHAALAQGLPTEHRAGPDGAVRKPFCNAG